MNPLEKLKSRSKKLGVHQVATPELLTGRETEETSDEERKLLEQQFLAEISGDEMDAFVDLWSELRDRYFDEEENAVPDYKRAAIAFCWCDDERNRFYSTASELWDVVQRLREFPSTLTSRMFVVANGANGFAGIDDETKKNSKVQTPSTVSAGGSGE